MSVVLHLCAQFNQLTIFVSDRTKGCTADKRCLGLVNNHACFLVLPIDLVKCQIGLVPLQPVCTKSVSATMRRGAVKAELNLLSIGVIFRSECCALGRSTITGILENTFGLGCSRRGRR